MLVVQMIAIVIAIPVSLLLYFFVERPGIQLGRIVAGKAQLPGLASRQ
jgi:peptidoglycan/LPS O-acetylase OafA/YrhL